MFDMVGKAKWSAWNSLGKISKDEAKKQYVNLITELAGNSSTETPATVTQTHGSSDSEHVTTRIDGKIYRILLNRPEKRNALTNQMYLKIIESLELAAKSKTSLTVLSGAGDFFCSGNDLGNFMNINPADIPKLAADARVLLRSFVNAFIDHPKPLIALVQGPAVGIAVTILGLFDAVYAADNATFNTPFTSLGQSPEGCSSYLFPQMMGLSKANEILLFGKKLTAQEAFDRSLVSEVFPRDTFKSETEHRVEIFSKLPPESLKLSKNLIRIESKDLLHRVNDRECELLEKRWQSEECMTAIMNFFTKKSNL